MGLTCISTNQKSVSWKECVRKCITNTPLVGNIWSSLANCKRDTSILIHANLKSLYRTRLSEEKKNSLEPIKRWCYIYEWDYQDLMLPLGKEKSGSRGFPRLIIPSWQDQAWGDPNPYLRSTNQKTYFILNIYKTFVDH